MKKLLSLVTIATLLPLGVSAHHGHNSQFDSTKIIEVSGVVTKIRFVNPHSYVHFDVTNAEGEVENWRCEMRAANVLKRSGWSADMFEPGTAIKVNGIASRKEATGCYAETLALGEAAAISRYDQLTENKGAAEVNRPATTEWGDPYIAGSWAAEQALAGADGPSYLGGPPGMGGGMGGMGGGMGAPGGMGGPPGGDGVAMTEAGKAAMAEMQAAAGDNGGQLDCKPRDFFSDWIFDQHANGIVQEKDTITMKYGFMDTTRVIHMTMSEHPADITPSFAGHSIGKWEDGVLVVNTVGFEPKLLTRGPFVSGATSAQYQTLERFTVDNEKGTLTRAYTATDPLYWEAGSETSGEQTISLSDYPWESYECEDLSVE